MRKDYTHITVILDRSGSMEEIRDDTIGGFNAFLTKQKEQAGSATLTLVQFDCTDPYEVIHRFMPMEDVPKLNRETFVPRGRTPLLDALGRGINDLEKGLSDLKKKNQPSKIVFVIVTDGQENSSREFTRGKIETMIKEKTEKNDWQFVFLSADLAAIGDAAGVGINQNSALLFAKDRKGSSDAWESLANRTVEFRSSGVSKFLFTDDDRKHPDDPGKKNV